MRLASRWCRATPGSGRTTSGCTPRYSLATFCCSAAAGCARAHGAMCCRAGRTYHQRRCFRLQRRPLSLPGRTAARVRSPTAVRPALQRPALPCPFPAPEPLTYCTIGLTPHHPDPHGENLQHVVAFLHSPTGHGFVALFWDQASLVQAAISPLPRATALPLRTSKRRGPAI